MVEFTGYQIRKIAMSMVKWIQEKISFSPRTTGKKVIVYKIPSLIFFEKIKNLYPGFGEVEWVRLLLFLKKTPELRNFYNCLLDIPPQYDGHSSKFFPEAYDGDEKMLVNVTREIKDLSSFYPETPGITEREWKTGDLVYIPRELYDIYHALKYLQKHVEENS
jgi:hypothetical protein